VTYVSSTSLKINEIFTSVKGEGLYIGQVMTFVRTAGCNLFCEGCDTPHFKGIEIDIVKIRDRLVEDKTPYVVLTGGEPLIQNSEALHNFVGTCHDYGKRVHLESNGTMHFDYRIFDWVCISPKGHPDDSPGLAYADEVKVPPMVWQDHKEYAEDSAGIPPKAIRYIQPWANKQFPDPHEINLALVFCHGNPKWRYSTQLHKTIGVK